MAMGPLSVSIVACRPPELLAPAGTFGFPDDEEHAAIRSGTRHARTATRMWVTSRG